MAQHHAQEVEIATWERMAAFVAFDAVGVRIAVADGAGLLKARADWVTPRMGGHGAVRDAIEEILRRQGRLDAAVAAYLARTGPETEPDGVARQ